MCASHSDELELTGATYIENLRRKIPLVLNFNSPKVMDDTSNKSSNADKTVMTWDRMISELHRIFATDNINIDEVKEVMYSYKSNPNDWKKYALFDPFRYTRNLVDAGNGRFNLMMLCWSEGQASSIHDHANAHCFMKQLQGSLTESLYEWPEDAVPEGEEEASRRNNSNSTTSDSSPMQLIKESTMKVDDVLYICDKIGLHRVSNPSHVEGAISLHLYCPPFQQCQVFDARTGRKNTVTATFWSMYGERCTRLRTDDSSNNNMIGETTNK